MINVQSQNHLRNELELCGIPESTNESVQHIALLAAHKVGIELKDDDIDWVARVGPKTKAGNQKSNESHSRPIVVRLLRKSKRDDIIKAAKSRRNITSKDLDIPGTPRKVYYNERLTKQFRTLFRDARIKTKEFRYLYCWCTQGTIYVKQNEGREAYAVRTYDDLNRIFHSP